MTLTRKQIYRRRRATVFGGAAIVLAIAFYLPMTLLAPVKGTVAAVQQPTIATAAAPSYAFPAYGASGVGAMGYQGLFASAGSPKALPMASISKLITTLVVLDAKPIVAGTDGATITMGAADVAQTAKYAAMNGLVYPVTPGQQFTEKQVIQMMLVASANNFAWSLADWAFGSEAGFLTQAQSWLTAHGMTSTAMSDPCGLSPQNVSTPADLIAVGKLALANPVIAPIVASKQLVIAPYGKLSNTNNLIGTDGVTGIKTGTLDTAGASLLFSSQRSIGSLSVTIVGVILDGPDHVTIDKQIRQLIATVVSGFREVTLTTSGQSFASYSTPWGARALAVPTVTRSVLVWGDTPVTAFVTASAVSLAGKGSSVGRVTFTIGSQKVVVPLALDRTIADPGPGWRLAHPGNLF